MNMEKNSSSPGVSRGLVISVIVGALVFLGLVVWILRTGGGIWG